MRIAFRVDSSLRIGTGHVIRCLTLALALRGRGAFCQFICREHEGHLINQIRQQGFEAIALSQRLHVTAGHGQGRRVVPHGKWLGTDWQTDAKQTIEALSGHRPEWLIVDHYSLDRRWEMLLRPHVNKIAVIDDLADRDHDCDLLLDQTPVSDSRCRYEGRIPERCVRLLGPQYSLLQAEYAEFHHRAPPRLGPAQRILVFFGGSDRAGVTKRAVSAFLALGRNDIRVDVVVGSHNPQAGEIKNLLQGCAQGAVYDALPSLAPLMLKADLAIGAGGMTSWERCCLGLPTLMITVAENQRVVAESLEREGLVRWIGHCDVVSEDDLLNALKNALLEPNLEHWSRACRALVDGGGTERVAAIVTLCTATRLKARLAQVDDEAQLLVWANDPLVRRNAFNSDHISADTHRTWFYTRLRIPERCRIFIVSTEENLPIGQVRFEHSDSRWEVHYALSPIARNRGLGTRLLSTALKEFGGAFPGAVVYGRVTGNNKASQEIFKQFQFMEEKLDDEFRYTGVISADGHVYHH